MHIPTIRSAATRLSRKLIRRIDAALEGAVDRVITCRPQHLILGISAERHLGGGSRASKRTPNAIRARAGDFCRSPSRYAIPGGAEGVRRETARSASYAPTSRRRRNISRPSFDECRHREFAKGPLHLSIVPARWLIAHVTVRTPGGGQFNEGSTARKRGSLLCVRGENLRWARGRPKR